MRGTGPLDRGYSGLTANQRVRLAIAALPRDDDRERALLWESATKQHYLSYEVAYVDVMDLASEFAMAFGAAELAPRFAQLELLESTQNLIERFLGARPSHERLAEPPPLDGDSPQERVELLLEALEMVREPSRSTWMRI